jgi:hypothetical protein
LERRSSQQAKKYRATYTRWSRAKAKNEAALSAQKKTRYVSENRRRFKENHKKTKCADMAQFLLENLNQNMLTR